MVDVTELRKVYELPGGGEVVAVNSITFQVASGDVFGLLGPNGAGKTTTIRMILGLLVPTAGTASIDGFRSDQSPTEVKRRIGLVSANAGIYPWQSARETLSYFADLYGVPRLLAEDRMGRLSETFGLGTFLDRRCNALSTGQKQRLNLARALVHDPPVLLLDEPTLGLDVLGSQTVAEFIDHVREQGKAVILCTHRLDEAERLATRFGLLDRGSMVIQGTLDELRAATNRHSLVEMFIDLAAPTRTISASPSEAVRS